MIAVYFVPMVLFHVHPFRQAKNAVIEKSMRMILNCKIKFILSFLLLSWMGANAQPHPILDDFISYLDNDKVLLKWTISSGSTCNGIKIYRSADVVSFTEIGSIAGVCGSSSSPVPYDFTDEAPIPNKINYYRLELGTQGFSDFISIEFIKLSSGNYLVRPNPVVDEAEILFQNESYLPMKFTLRDVSGNEVMTKENITDDFILFRREGLNDGLYIFTIEYKGYVKVKGKIILSSR